MSGNSYGNLYAGGNASVHLGNVNQTIQLTGPTEEERCLQLFKTSCYEDHKDRNPERVADTCCWALNHENFQNWQASQNNALLWISADPGCGKSVFSRALIDERLCGNSSSTICYFFFKDNEEQDSLSTALCALLHQLFSHKPELLRHALPAWRRNRKELKNETREMWRIFQAATADPAAGTVICILDALDECKDNDRRQLIECLCDLHESQNSSKVGTTKFLVTSRPYQNVETWFRKAVSVWPKIRLRGEEENEQINKEINVVIRRRMVEMQEDFDIPPCDYDRILQQLLDMKHRTYLWLRLAMEEVREMCEHSIFPDEMQVSPLPLSVEDGYERMLSRIKESHKQFARQVLLIVIAARRPLHIAEMALALSTARAERNNESSLTILDCDRLWPQIREQCRLFVFSDHDNLFLIHQTAKDFLVTQSEVIAEHPGSWKFCLQESQVERTMGIICVTYLRIHHRMLESNHFTPREYYSRRGEILQFGGTALGPETYDFFQYCANHWFSHLSDDLIEASNDLSGRVVTLYEPGSRIFDWWVSILWWTRYGSHFEPGLPGWYDQWPAHHALAVTGQSSILRRMLGVEIALNTIDAVDSSGRTALRWAAQCGHIGIVETLLDRQVRKNEDSKSAGSPLHIASKLGHAHIVQVLLAHDADPKARDLFKSTALHAAASAGHTQIVQQLLHSGAEVSARDMDGDTALNLAFEKGYAEIVRLLFQNGADWHELGNGKNQAITLWNGLETSKDQAIMTAWQADNLELMEILIEIGADLSTRTPDDITILELAYRNGNGRWVKFLLEHGADIHNLLFSNESLLINLCDLCGLEMVDALFNSGANQNLLQEYVKYDPASLTIACDEEYDKLANILIRSGADAGFANEEGDTMLVRAALRGSEKIVRVLLSNKVDPNSFSVSIENLQYFDIKMVGGSLRQWLEAVVTESEHLIDLSLCRRHSWQEWLGALISTHVASVPKSERKSLLDVVDQTLTSCVMVAHEMTNSELPGNYGKEVTDEMKNMLEYLVSRTQSVHDRTALSAASTFGHTTIVQHLLEHGAKTSDRHYARAISNASLYGHEGIVQILLEQNTAAKLRWHEFERKAAELGYQDVHDMASQTGAYFSLDRLFHRSTIFGKQLEDLSDKRNSHS